MDDIATLEELLDWLKATAGKEERMAQAAGVSGTPVWQKYADALDRLLTERANMVAVPDGWKLVPIGPTEDMRRKGLEELVNQIEKRQRCLQPTEDEAHRLARMYALFHTSNETDTVWNVMLAAAPKPPLQTEMRAVVDAARKLIDYWYDAGCNCNICAEVRPLVAALDATEGKQTP